MAFDEVCTQHMQDKNPQSHDPSIAQHVEHLAVQLLRGDPNFMKDWMGYIQELRKGTPNPPANAPDVRNADNRESDAAVDLHCAAPVEARLQRNGDNSVSLDIDDWRSYVNATVANLGSGKWTAQQAQDELNLVRPEDRQVAAADFNRDCLLARLNYEATTRSDGTILVNAKNTTTGMR